MCMCDCGSVSRGIGLTGMGLSGRGVSIENRLLEK